MDTLNELKRGYDRLVAAKIAHLRTSRDAETYKHRCYLKNVADGDAHFVANAKANVAADKFHELSDDTETFLLAAQKAVQLLEHRLEMDKNGQHPPKLMASEYESNIDKILGISEEDKVEAIVKKGWKEFSA